eukprot:1230147-Rhodomonas_salina.2
MQSPARKKGKREQWFEFQVSGSACIVPGAGSCNHALLGKWIAYPSVVAETVACKLTARPARYRGTFWQSGEWQPPVFQLCSSLKDFDVSRRARRASKGGTLG